MAGDRRAACVDFGARHFHLFRAINPLVTIGIPSFDSARWLRGAIESALAQDWPAVEVIVVDDGSSDGSRGILREFGSSIRVFLTEHRGANHARNTILREARGEWIQHLDADDFLLPEKISRQFAESGGGLDCDVIYSPVLIEQDGARRASVLDSRADLIAQWIAWELPQTGGCLWRTRALERVGGWNVAMPCCQEHELYQRALQAGLRFHLAPTPNAVYRVWSDETLCRKDPQLVVEVKTALIDRFYEWLKSRGLWTSEHARQAGRACFEMARTLAKIDLSKADAYHAERRKRGMIHLAGPAAPLAYRLLYQVTGFSAAERIAAARRPKIAA